MRKSENAHFKMIFLKLFKKEISLKMKQVVGVFPKFTPSLEWFDSIESTISYFLFTRNTKADIKS